MQFEFPGTIGVPDGRYLAREEDGERVLVIETLGAPRPPRRRRGRPKDSEETEPTTVPLSRITAIRAQEPFDSEADAASWLEVTVGSEDSTDAALAEAMALLNRALHAAALASADSFAAELRAEKAAIVRIGHGSGKEVAAGRFTEAKALDPRVASGSRRRRREEELRPQERLAAILGGREQADTCETLILRARADLDAARSREAALQLRVALEALLVELDGALADLGHDEDMTELRARKGEAGGAGNAALQGDLSTEQENQVQELVAICERVLRRRRVLRG